MKMIFKGKEIYISAYAESEMVDKRAKELFDSASERVEFRKAYRKAAKEFINSVAPGTTGRLYNNLTDNIGKRKIIPGFDNENDWG